MSGGEIKEMTDEEVKNHLLREIADKLQIQNGPVEYKVVELKNIKNSYTNIDRSDWNDRINNVYKQALQKYRDFHQKTLNELGEQGWTLTHIDRGAGSIVFHGANPDLDFFEANLPIYYHFKRPLTEKARQLRAEKKAAAERAAAAAAAEKAAAEQAAAEQAAAIKAAAIKAAAFVAAEKAVAHRAYQERENIKKDQDRREFEQRKYYKENPEKARQEYANIHDFEKSAAEQKAKEKAYAEAKAAADRAFEQEYEENERRRLAEEAAAEARALQYAHYISENRRTKFRPLPWEHGDLSFSNDFINPDEFSSDEAWEAALAEAKAAADRAFEQENGENERRRIAEITSHMRSQGHEVTEWETAVFFADKNAADDKVAAEELAAEFYAQFGRTPSPLEVARYKAFPHRYSRMSAY